MTEQLIPARQAVAVRVPRGAPLRVVNTFGQQVVDTWAFVDAAEWMSMEHSRLHIGRVNPRVGDTFVTTRRRAVLTPGRGHLRWRPRHAAGRLRPLALRAARCAGHDNCTDNLHAALASVGLAVPCTPSPLNLFENAPPARRRRDRDPAAGLHAGSHVTLRAELDALVVLSACPQDLAPTNGPGPRDAHYELEEPR